MNPKIFRPSATPVALCHLLAKLLLLPFYLKMCPYAVAAATYVKKQLGMHVRGLQRWASKFLLSCPWANEVSYPNEI